MLLHRLPFLSLVSVGQNIMIVEQDKQIEVLTAILEEQMKQPNYKVRIVCTPLLCPTFHSSLLCYSLYAGLRNDRVSLQVPIR
jgi:hypothetical protein